jgi:Domain of unknown function (DUF4114)
MAVINLGTPIAGSIASTDTLTADGYQYYDEYDLPSLAGFSQLDIKLTPDSGVRSPQIELINAATGATVSSSSERFTTPFSLAQSTVPGVNYKLRVTGGSTIIATDPGLDPSVTAVVGPMTSAGFGNYQLSVTDGGKGTSLISPAGGGVGPYSGIGTVGQSGAYFSLGGVSDGLFGASILTDVAKTTNGQFYATGFFGLYRVDPSLAVGNQNKPIDLKKDSKGNGAIFSSLESGADNKLYSLGFTASDSRENLYQFDVTTDNPTETFLGTLPQEFSFARDLVFDAANNRLLATSLESTETDALWQIPLINPAGASKIGSIGISNIDGLSFEGGQLFGYTGSDSSSANPKKESNRIKIDIGSGKGTLDGVITQLPGSGVNGAGTIVGGNTIKTPITSTTPVTPVVSTSPTSAVDAIGTKGQSLANRTIDLTDFAGILKLNQTTKGDAAYNNNIGFYAVQDASGTIKLANGSTLKPGDANYALEAVKSALGNAGLAGKNDSKLNQDILGSTIYAPVVVAQGSLSDFTTKNPSNGGDGKLIHAYFNYLGANPDKFDHFKLTSPNTFAVEDQYGGGDKDFNDLIVTMNIRKA